MSSNSACNHTHDEQIGLPLRGRPILSSLVYDYRPNWTPLSPVTITCKIFYLMPVMGPSFKKRNLDIAYILRTAFVEGRELSCHFTDFEIPSHAYIVEVLGSLNLRLVILTQSLHLY